MPDRPVCPMCHEPGIHPTTDRCLEEMRAQRDQLLTIRRWHTEPSMKYLRYYYAEFYP